MSLTAKLVLSPLLVAQALRTRAKLPLLPEAAGERQGEVGDGQPLRLLILGDSSAAGVGVVHQRDALAGQLVNALARRTRRHVQWRLLARSGLNTEQLLALLLREQRTLAHHPFDLAVVVTGVNDVVDQVPSHRAVALREALANTLRNALGVAHVVFAPLPPLYLIPGLPQPLRWVAGRDARRHDRALAQWAATRADVSHLDVELPLNAGVMADDGFHPGAPVYRLCGHAMAEHIALAVWPGLSAGPRS